MTRSNRFLLAAPLFTLAVPGLLAAQVCLGRPSLQATRGSVGLAAEFYDGGKAFGANGTVGREFFATGSFMHNGVDDSDLSLNEFTGGVGLAGKLGGRPNVSVCPMALVTYSTGLEILGVDFSSLTFAPAVAAGFSAELSPTLDVAPFARGAVLFRRLKADAGTAQQTRSETDGLLVLGLDLIVNDVFSIGPTVNIPVATDGGDTSFSVAANVGFRR